MYIYAPSSPAYDIMKAISDSKRSSTSNFCAGENLCAHYLLAPIRIVAALLNFFIFELAFPYTC